MAASDKLLMMPRSMPRMAAVSPATAFPLKANDNAAIDAESLEP